MAKIVKITIPYKPREWAKKLHESKERWKVLVLHRRAGKTVAVINHLIRKCLEIPNSRFAYIAPTYKQAKNIVWDYLKYYSFPVPNSKPNEAELKMDYPNGSRLQLFGSENIDALRGLALWGGAQDESSQQPANLFSEVISKALADHLGFWIWLGTPKGKNQFYRTYETGLKSDDYFTLFQTIDDTLATEKGETIENLGIALKDDRKLVDIGEMTEEEFQQEWYCNWEAAIKGAIYLKEIALAKKHGRIGNVPYDKALPVYTVWDIGTKERMAIGFYQKTGVSISKIDFWEGSSVDSGLPQAIRAVKEKGYIYGKHFAPHDIIATSRGTGKTLKETAENLGIKFEVVPKISINDGIVAGKLMFSKLFVDEKKCQFWLDYISQYRREWDDRRGIFKDNPLHDFTSHGADEYRYASVVQDKMINDEIIFKQEPYEPASEFEGGEVVERKKIIDPNELAMM